MTDFLDRLKEKLISEEGMELMPYHCPKVGEDAGGKLSIGVGRNLEERGITAQERRICCRQILKLFTWN